MTQPPSPIGQAPRHPQTSMTTTNYTNSDRWWYAPAKRGWIAAATTADASFFPKCRLVLPRVQHLWHEFSVLDAKTVSKNLKKHSMCRALRATMLPRFAADGKHRRTQCCHHNASSFCRRFGERNCSVSGIACTPFFTSNNFTMIWDAILLRTSQLPLRQWRYFLNWILHTQYRFSTDLRLVTPICSPALTITPLVSLRPSLFIWWRSNEVRVEKRTF